MVGNFYFYVFLLLTWEFLDLESECGGSVCWLNNKIIEDNNRVKRRSSAGAHHRTRITPPDYAHHSRIDTSHGTLNFFRKQPPWGAMSRLVRVFRSTHAHRLSARGQRHGHGSVHRGAHQDDHASAMLRSSG